MRKSPGKDNVVRGTSRRKTLEKRQRNNSECGNGRLDRDLKKQLRLRMRRTSSRNYRTPMQLEEENRVVSSTIELQDVLYWTFWKVRPLPKRKKDVRRAQGPEALERRPL
jgi:hypothetical protein